MVKVTAEKDSRREGSHHGKPSSQPCLAGVVNAGIHAWAEDFEIVQPLRDLNAVLDDCRRRSSPDHNRSIAGLRPSGWALHLFGCHGLRKVELILANKSNFANSAHFSLYRMKSGLSFHHS